MLEVKVKLYPYFQKSLYNNNVIQTLVISDNACINDLMLQLNIELNEVGVILRDGKPVDKTAELHNGVLIEMYPIFGGG